MLKREQQITSGNNETFHYLLFRKNCDFYRMLMKVAASIARIREKSLKKQNDGHVHFLSAA